MKSPTETQLAENAPPVDATPNAKPRPWQFSLRDAFWLTTAAAGAAALAAATKSLGSFVLSANLFLAWLNVQGRFERVQTRQARPKVFYGAWLLLGASLFLPAVEGCNNSALYGWQAAYFCAIAEADAVVEIARAADTREAADWWRMLPEAGYVTLVNLANLLAILSPLLLWRLQQERGQRLGALLAVSAVAVWAVPLDDVSGLLIGCYVWCVGYTFLILAYQISRGTFVVMCALAAIFVYGALT